MILFSLFIIDFFENSFFAYSFPFLHISLSIFLSCLEILASVFQLGNVNKDLHTGIDFIISKGHAEIGTYLILRE